MSEAIEIKQARAKAMNVRIAPRKVRVVVDLVRGKNVGDAMAILSFVPKRASEVVLKVIKSAAANAENNFDLNPDGLRVKSANHVKGQDHKRGIARRARVKV